VKGDRREKGRGLALRAVATRTVMIAVLLLSAALVWQDLGAREVLGRDESATITKLDQPNVQAVLRVTGIKITGEPGNMQPLYFVLQYLSWPLVQRSAFVLRFLPSVFALLGVVLTYKLGEALLGPTVGLLGALFTALLPLHVRYAQIARPYTLLALLALASAYFLVRGLTTNRPLHWAGFVLTATLSFYTHYNALLFLAAEGLFAGVTWLTMLGGVLRKRQPARSLIGSVLAFLLVGALCLPGFVRLVGLPWVGLEGSGESDSTVAVQFTVPFFYRFLNEIGLTTAWLRGLLLGLMSVGLAATLYRRRWQAALFSILWLAIPFVSLSLMKSPRPFEERYVIFVPPVAMLLVGQGVVAIGQAVGALGQQWHPRRIRWAVTIALSAGLALLFVAPLRTYYVANRSADRLDQALAMVERQARAGDLVVVSPRALIRPLALDGAQVLYLTEHLSAAELDDLTSRSQRIWFLYTSFLPAVELQEPLDQWVQAQGDAFLRVPIKAPSALSYGNLALTDAEASLKDRTALLEEVIRLPAGTHGQWVRHGILADTYQALGDLYASQGDAALAEEYWHKARETRAAAPAPW
jgi:4-amino-4-deoxy-L-arabinose transferase-like glycosyltransferase